MEGYAVPIALVSLAALALVLFTADRFLRQTRSPWDEVARLFGGILREPTRIESPAVVITHRHNVLLVERYSAGATSYIRFRAPWPDKAFALGISPEGKFSRALQLLGIRDIPVDAPAFDARYRIVGPNEAAVQRLLTPLVRGLLERLFDLGEEGGLYWTIEEGEFILRKPGRFVEADLLRRFTRWTVELYEVTLEQASDLELGLSAAEPNAEAGVCQVCGEQCIGAIVLCAACQTPHHLDCWNYAQRCAVYGCGSQEHRPQT